MQLPIDKKILILRYGTNIISDCMKLHQEVINSEGYCWFGKLGRAPSDKVIQQIMEDGEGYVVLYAREGAYGAKFTEVTDKKPLTAYPEYYNALLFDEGYIPTVYFKLLDLKPLATGELQNLAVSSSKNALVDTLNKSMNSFFCAEYKQGKEIIKSKKTDHKDEKKDKLVVEGCRYRENGKCNRRGFVNYQYECERPKLCIGQKL